MIAETRRRGGRKPLPMIQRFASKIEIGPRREDCWLWTGSLSSGYGQMNGRGHRGCSPVRASHVAYELFKGPLIPGLHVCHSCDNPRCVNPAHLWLGDDMANSLDKRAKGRSNTGERHGKAKLTTAQVQEIRALRRDGVAASRIAERFGITRAYVYRVQHGMTWGHLAEVA